MSLFKVVWHLCGIINALLLYRDFYCPEDQGMERKTVLCRRITVHT